MPWNDEAAADLFTWAERLKPPAETLAAMMADRERIARECLADPTTMEGGPTQHWARELLEAVVLWRKAAAPVDPAVRELAAFRAGEAWGLLWVYGRDTGGQRALQQHGALGGTAKADAHMAEMRERMAELPRDCLKDAPTVRRALLAAGWESPWTERVTMDRIREVLREMR